MRSPALAVAAALAASVTAVATAGSQAAGVESQAIAPFVYEFRIVGFSAKATLTYANTSATIEYRLVEPSIARTIVYLPRSGSRIRFATPLLDTVARATYTSPDPTCTGKTIEYRPRGNAVVQVFVGLDPFSGVVRRVKAEARKVPLASPSPGQDAGDPGGSEPRPKCGRPEMGGWYENMVATAPVRGVSKPRLAIRGTRRERFTDPGIESIEWSLEVTLQRLQYRPIDCSKHPGC